MSVAGESSRSSQSGTDHTANAVSKEPIEKYIDLTSLARILWRRRLGVTVTFALIVAGAFAYTYLLATEYYESRATLMPLKQGDAGPMSALRSLGSVGNMLGGIGVSLPGTDTDRLLNILESDAMREGVAAELGVLPHFARHEIDAARNDDKQYSWDDPYRLAVELVASHPGIVRAVNEDDPERGILSMSTARLVELAEGVGDVSVGATAHQLQDVRAVWHRVVERTIRSFVACVSVHATRQDLVVITARIPESAELAARVPNTFVGALEAYLRENTTTQARRYRDFMNEYLDTTESELELAEERLEAFKRESGLLSLPDQLSGWLSRAGELQAQLEAKRIARDVLTRAGVSRQNPQVQVISLEVDALEAQLEEIHGGTGNFLADIGFTQVPELETRLSELMRDKVVKSTLYTLIVQEYEAARMQAARDETSFTRLDVAQRPARPTRPRHAADIAVGGVLAALLSLTYGFAVEALFRGRAA